MTLLPGTNIGPYHILSLIGAGGMGEVYKATDTRLNRTVAIKVLPEKFSQNVEMRQRFEREAQTIGALNHPHICTLFDVGRDEDVSFLVMEYLEGETLAQRLERGAVPLTEALNIAIEIAEALDKAHGQGIVHRDLKPSNVMWTKSGAKLLDFGLAKLKTLDRQTTVSTMPTRTDMTAEGTIVGTMQYMAPEQLEGKAADSRTDIFSFGVLLYEMLTGRKAFSGSSQASLISAIMSADPKPVSLVQPLTPPALEHVLKICLAKDPELRWQTARDVAVQLRWIVEGGSNAGIQAPIAAQRQKRERLAWLLFIMTTLLLIAMSVPTVLYFTRSGADEIRFNVPLPDALPVGGGSMVIGVSPDGRWIVFGAPRGGGIFSLFVRPINSTDVRELPGTQMAGHSVFWSPDSRQIAFFATNKLKRVDIVSGPSQEICDAVQPGGGAWNSDGTIVFSSRGVLNRVSSAGGPVKPLTTLDESRQETAHILPSFLPDGRHYFFLALSKDMSKRAVYAGTLDSDVRTPILDAPSRMTYAEPGHAFYQRDGALFSQEFDVRALKLTGRPALITDRIMYSATFSGAFSVSQNGTLVYRTASGGVANRQLVWFDRSGREIGTVGEAGTYQNFDLSPDGKNIAVAHSDPTTNNRDIWLIDPRGVRTRFTYDPAPEGDVVWSPDGLSIAFQTMRNGTADVFEKKVSGIGNEVVLLDSASDEWVEDWSKDGRYIAYVTDSQLAVLPMFGDRKTIRVTQSPFHFDEPHFSYDTKWLAYNSDESGTWQVYVTSFPGLNQRFQISTAGGAQPRWRKDGKELYYLDVDGKMMAVDMVSRVPRVLFETGLILDPIRDQYAVTPDGQRFLLLRSVAGADSPGITVVVNWPASIKN